MTPVSVATSFTLFETSIGQCGIVWTADGIVGIQLPEALIRQRIEEHHPGALPADPPAFVTQAASLIERHLAGEQVDLSGIALWMDGLPGFRRRVYEAARLVPAGTTVSYGQLAGQIGSPGAARAVGQALGRNPFPIVVPCHRVLAAGGKIGGFSADGGAGTKRRMLAIEGVAVTTAAVTTVAGFGFDPRRALRHLRTADAGLGALIDAAGPFTMELQAAESTFTALSEAIVYQQLNPKAAATIYGRFRALSGAPDGAPAPERLMALTDDELRAVGLSRAKTRAMRDLAERTLAGEIPELAEARSLPDEELIQRLSAVRGVGRWTAEMFLMFRLGRPDILPLGDYGLRRGYGIAFAGGRVADPGEIAQRAEPWRPYRTVASWYLWRAAESTPL